MTAREFAKRMNSLTAEEIATAMESLPTDVLEWAVRFEALRHPADPSEASPITPMPPHGEPPSHG